MAEDHDIPLPSYSGRLSGDWSSHEARLKSWLRVKGIPSHAREAADVLSLSLEPRSQAALLFSWASPAQRYSFDESVAFMQKHFGSAHRKQLAQGSAQNAMTVRTFRMKGKRTEFIKDLLGDLEVLFLRAGIVDDLRKREVFIKCFIEFPGILRRMADTALSYEAAVMQALQWESRLINRPHKVPPAPPPLALPTVPALFTLLLLHPHFLNPANNTPAPPSALATLLLLPRLPPQ
ncbi:hypothetical protein RQP46_006815 [Phenoliferia psychrophenolica]